MCDKTELYEQMLKTTLTTTKVLEALGLRAPTLAESMAAVSFALIEVGLGSEISEEIMHLSAQHLPDIIEGADKYAESKSQFKSATVGSWRDDLGESEVVDFDITPETQTVNG